MAPLSCQADPAWYCHLSCTLASDSLNILREFQEFAFHQTHIGKRNQVTVYMQILSSCLQPPLSNTRLPCFHSLGLPEVQKTGSWPQAKHVPRNILGMGILAEPKVSCSSHARGGQGRRKVNKKTKKQVICRVMKLWTERFCPSPNSQVETRPPNVVVLSEIFRRQLGTDAVLRGRGLGDGISGLTRVMRELASSLLSNM